MSLACQALLSVWEAFMCNVPGSLPAVVASFLTLESATMAEWGREQSQIVKARSSGPHIRQLREFPPFQFQPIKHINLISLSIQAGWLSYICGSWCCHIKMPEKELILMQESQERCSMTTHLRRPECFRFPGLLQRIFNYSNTAAPVLLQCCKAAIKAEKAFSF